MTPMEALDRKLAASVRNNAYQKRLYWDLRITVIDYLGGKCDCGECSVSKLEIHHDPPILYSVKRNGYPRGGRSGYSRIKEWRLIIAGKMEAKLVCRTCHLNNEHNGNTNELKKVTDGRSG